MKAPTSFELADEGGWQDVIHHCTRDKSGRQSRRLRHIDREVVNGRDHILKALLHLSRRDDLQPAHNA